MSRAGSLIVLSLLLATCVGGQAIPVAPVETPVSSESTPRFAAVDIFIDPQGQPLAAYQVQVTAIGADVTLVGIEGGESPAFSAAPYYDKRAILSQRIVIAALNTGTALPTGKTRMATMMLRIVGAEEPRYQAALQVAGSVDGKPMNAVVTLAPATASEGAAK